MARLALAKLALMHALPGVGFNISKLEREGDGPIILKPDLMHGDKTAVKCAKAGCKRCLVDICAACWQERRDCECNE